ncbi:MAG: ABC transporter substrate-binding protein [Chloroflexota bacterium]
MEQMTESAPGASPTRGAVSRRRFAALASGSIGAQAALTACASSGDQAPAASATPQTVRLWFGLAPTHTTILAAREVVKRFVAENPYKISLNQEELQSGPNNKEKVVTALAAGDPPDASWLPFFEAVDFHVRGALADTETVFKGEKAWRERRDDMFPVVREKSTWKGKLAGIPIVNSAIAIAYSRPVFARAGVPAPKSDWTWNDLVAIAKRTASPPEVHGFGIGTTGAYVTILWFLQFFGTTGKSLFNKELTKVEFPQVEMEQTAKFIYDLFYTHQVSPWPAQAELLQNNTGAMELQGAYRVPVFEQKGVSFGAVRLPNPPFGKPARANYGGGHNVLVFKKGNADKELAAARVALYMTDKWAQQQQVMNAYNIPVTKSAAESPELKQWLATRPDLKVWIDESEFTTMVNALPSGQKVYMLMGDALQEYFAQKVSLSAALENMRRLGQQQLDDDLKR